MLLENSLTQFLKKEILISDIVYLDYWSVVHLGAGAILAKFVKDWKVALVLLFLYELLEYITQGIVFIGESNLDIIWDLIIGLGGWYIGRKFLWR